MSSFEVNVRQIQEPVEHHPNADRLSIIKIDGYVTIAAKNEDGSHRYKQGDFVVYIPQNSIVTQEFMKKYGYWNDVLDHGMFSGAGYNRVKPVKLRGTFSEGIIIPVTKENDTLILENQTVELGQDVAELLGIEKYEPSVPAKMAGQMGAYYDYTKKYDFENQKSQPGLFNIEDYVVATEKLHGTLCCFGYIPELTSNDFFGEQKHTYVTSKGIGARGFVIKNVIENTHNIYAQFARKIITPVVEEKLDNLSAGRNILIFGEIFGKGVQDLTYSEETPTLRIFDVMIGGEWLTHDRLVGFCYLLNLETVPVLYEGLYNHNLFMELATGKSTLDSKTLREGVVVKSFTNDRHPKYGRKIAKFINPDYLLRKNGTEYN